jgi:hypothetical protein
MEAMEIHGEDLFPHVPHALHVKALAERQRDRRAYTKTSRAIFSTPSMSL